ncbi:MAG: hypothetical protein FJ146_17715 [Deltaproteobacteria bacterium]|nr:hypothetical protein [Deltaproteobacteria bacterium]
MNLHLSINFIINIMNFVDMLALLASAFLTMQTVHAATVFTTGYKELWRTRYAILGDPARGVSTYCTTPSHQWQSRFLRCKLDLYWWQAGQMTTVCSDADSPMSLKVATAARRRYRLVYRCQVDATEYQYGERKVPGDVAVALPEVTTILYR